MKDSRGGVRHPSSGDYCSRFVPFSCIHYFMPIIITAKVTVLSIVRREGSIDASVAQELILSQHELILSAGTYSLLVFLQPSRDRLFFHLLCSALEWSCRCRFLRPRGTLNKYPYEKKTLLWLSS